MLADHPFQSVLTAAQTGADWAWARLVDELDPVLRGYVRRLGSQDPDDLVGETWLHVARGIKRFAGDEQAFRSWIFMIAHHRLLDERRRLRRRPAESVEPQDLERVSPASPSAEAEAMKGLTEEEVVRLLEVLTPDQREVVLLRVMGGFSVEEVGKIMAKKPGAIQALQHRAFRRLEKTLREGVRFQPRAAVTELR